MKWIKQIWGKMFCKKPEIFIPPHWGESDDYEDWKFDLEHPGAREFHEDCGDRQRKERIINNDEKNTLRRLVLAGLSQKEISKRVFCSTATIRNYIKALRPKQKEAQDGG